MKPTRLFLLFCAALAALLAGCGGNATPTPAALEGAERDAVVAYSQPITDALMAAYQQGDHAAFVADFTDEMKKAMTEANFNKLRQQLDSQIGAYESHSFDRAIDFGDYVTVYYQSKFAKTDKVHIVVSFTKTEPHQVSGLWFR